MSAPIRAPVDVIAHGRGLRRSATSSEPYKAKAYLRVGVCAYRETAHAQSGGVKGPCAEPGAQTRVENGCTGAGGWTIRLSVSAQTSLIVQPAPSATAFACGAHGAVPAVVADDIAHHSTNS